jgi:hypothetical protein
MRIKPEKKIRVRLRRLCADCNEKFYPTGKFARFCFKCMYARRGGRR